MSRPYGLGLLVGIGAGLVLSSGTLLILYATGYGVTGTTALLSWLGLFTTGLGIALVLAPFVFPDPVETVIVERAPTPVPHSPTFTQATVHGRGPGTWTRYQPATSLEREWIIAACEFLLWARSLGSLGSPQHLKAGSVRNPNDWQEIIAPLIDHGAILPTQNGVLTRFAPEWDATRAFNAVIDGWVEFPERPAPRIVPFPAASATVDVELLSKAKADIAV